MLTIEIPGGNHLELAHLFLDYNGTLACDGTLLAGISERLEALSEKLLIHVLTADTFGSVRQELAGVPCRLSVIPKEDQAQAKLDHVQKQGSDKAVCIGNGRNDWLMLKNAALGIAVVQAEGAAVEAVLAADVVTLSIVDALDLLLNPLRLAATLRS